jgi:hypothetical protein
MASQEDVEFKTVDGVTLRGKVFPAKERGAGVVMSPGVSRHAVLSVSRSHLLANSYHLISPITSHILGEPLGTLYSA